MSDEASERLSDFVVSVDTTNDAFEDGQGGSREVARILHALGDALASGHIPSIVRDANGNTVGWVEWE